CSTWTRAANCRSDPWSSYRASTVVVGPGSMSSTLPRYTPSPTEPATTPAMSGPSPTIHFVNVAAPAPSDVVVDSLTMVSIADPSPRRGRGARTDPASGRGGEPTTAAVRVRLARGSTAGPRGHGNGRP